VSRAHVPARGRTAECHCGSVLGVKPDRQKLTSVALTCRARGCKALHFWKKIVTTSGAVERGFVTWPGIKSVSHSNEEEPSEAVMRCLSRGWMVGLMLAFVPWCFAEEKVIVPDLSRIQDGKTWTVINADCLTASEDGRGVVRMKPKGKVNTPSDIGLALVEGLDFIEGTLEIDLKGKGRQEASFLGLAFSALDGKTFEAVYFRPFNFLNDDQAFRARAVQYVAWPEHTWAKLRQKKPGVYESTVKPVPDPADWFHARVEITKQKVNVWIDTAKEPCLVVDRLASHEKGKVGLWVDSREGTFRNLKISPAK
jgi:hypothetical protein